MASLLGFLAFSGGMSVIFAGQASALLTSVVAVNSATCDPLGLGGAGGAPILVEELGTEDNTYGTSSAFPLSDSGISATASFSGSVACAANYTVGVGSQIELSITNETTRSFSDLWYVSDGLVSITNIDGEINGFSAFKIDGTLTSNANNPLISESLGVNEVFEPGETWTFILDGFNDLVYAAPTSTPWLGSVGVGTDSDQISTVYLSSGSIIAFVPEPSTALLIGLGLAGLAMPRRWRGR
jgi:hypothetical protein